MSLRYEAYIRVRDEITQVASKYLNRDWDWSPLWSRVGNKIEDAILRVDKGDFNKDKASSSMEAVVNDELVKYSEGILEYEISMIYGMVLAGIETELKRLLEERRISEKASAIRDVHAVEDL